MIRVKNDNRHIVDTLFVLTLFAVFAICSMLLIAFGASIYQKTIDNLENHFTISTSVAYVSEKLRQGDSSGSIKVVEFGDSDAFMIASTINETDYYTYIYIDEGYLKELYTKADSELGPHAGQKLLPVSQFVVTSQDEGTYSFLISDSNNQSILTRFSSKCDTIQE